MAAPAGNQFWALRETHGRQCEYATVPELAEGIIAYAEWAKANPWKKPEQLKKPVILGVDEKTGQKIYQTIIYIDTERPMSIGELCDHLGITTTTWGKYKKREDFTDIVTRTEQFIKSQQWTGAAVGAFQQNIIARTLGLVEKQETGFRDKDGNPTDPPKPVIITAIFPDTARDI